MAALCPEAKAFQDARRDEELPDVHAEAVQVARKRVAQDVPAPAEGEIWMAVNPAALRALASAAQAD